MLPPCNRRQFLRVGAFGASFNWPDMLRAAAAGRAAGRPARAKSAILVFLAGGPSHIDTFDPKPAAPAEVRGEFRTVPTRLPGIRFCEHLPRLAGMLDKLSVLRAVTGMDTEHSDVTVMTGYALATARAVGHPSAGSVVSKFRGVAGGVPPFVSLRGISAGCEPGFLGLPHRPYSPTGQMLSELKLPPGVTPARFTGRRALLASLDSACREADTAGAISGMDAFQRLAFDLITSGEIGRALDISREPTGVLERYDGVEQFLKARRLVEAGVGCVTLSVGEWDTHKHNFTRMKDELLPPLDRGLSALLEDLHDRGLAESTIVVAWGEFGRSPRVNKEAGRDHWTPVMSAIVAGGGLRPGVVVGETSAWGDQPRDGACSVQRGARDGLLGPRHRSRRVPRGSVGPAVPTAAASRPDPRTPLIRIPGFTRTKARGAKRSSPSPSAPGRECVR